MKHPQHISFFSLFVFFLAATLFNATNTIIAQDCSDELTNGDEFRIDCGGIDCPQCINLLYEGVYNAQDVLELFITLPPYIFLEEEYNLGYYYIFTGDFEQVCLEFPECQALLLIPPNTNAVVNVTKYNPAGEEIAYGRLKVKALCRSCVGPDAGTFCDPVTSDLAVTPEAVPLDTSFYMMKLGLTGGIPPYRIFDSANNLYFDDEIYDSLYYLGAFPDSLVLDLIVFDAVSCDFTLDSLHQYSGLMEPQDTMVENPDTMQMDTVISSLAVLDIANVTDETLKIYPTITNTSNNANQSSQSIYIEFEIDGQLLESTTADLKVYNLNSGSIRTVFDDKLVGLGANKWMVPGQAISTGINFVYLEIGGRRFVRKVVGF